MLDNFDLLHSCYFVCLVNKNGGWKLGEKARNLAKGNQRDEEKEKGGLWTLAVKNKVGRGKLREMHWKMGENISGGVLEKKIKSYWNADV